MSRILQLKWSDEPNWKDVRHLKLDESAETALDSANTEWVLEKTRRGLKHDAEFRVISESSRGGSNPS